METPEKQYQPIDCNYYDRLEAWATMQTLCVLSFHDEDGHPQEVTARITNLYTLNKAEYLQLDNGLVLRLDRLLSVNGIPLPGVC
ncbi:hypothetical protein EGT74_14225 [Chitinophaga lutea]|uniref:Rho-binding antiterminator n=1 Tax=Chitinophaga lutea TaxID=2488634 RepID=A0A3N4PVP6_9BACT|nr:hypothetical protein [Chitinophaga lutea]RPE08217.1 hypothetical protein EGT74_14225 [Chitinophaga lutea]